jgi:hypothetical protein
MLFGFLAFLAFQGGMDFSLYSIYKIRMHRKNPNVCISGRMHRKQMSGMGMGSVLMNPGGAGGGSSYMSVQDYSATTGNRPAGTGFRDKLDKLMVKPLTKKPQNIRFEM